MSLGLGPVVQAQDGHEHPGEGVREPRHGSFRRGFGPLRGILDQGHHQQLLHQGFQLLLCIQGGI